MLQSHLISQSFSTPYVKQQNGLAESTIRHLTNTTRSLLLSSDLPRTLWGEAMQTAAHLINIRFKKSIETSPYFAFYSIKPSIDHLRVWGTPAYALTPSECRSSHLKKLGSKSKKLYLVGYTESDKIFRLYDKQNRKVERHTNVIFLEENLHENQNPKLNSSTIQDNNDQLSIENRNTNDFNYNNSIDNIDTNNSTLNLNENINTNNQTSNLSETKRKYVRKNHQKIVRNLRSNPIKALIAIPQQFNQIKNDPLWLQAAKEEMQQHKLNKTWTLVDRPKDATVIQCRWVFATKRSMENELIYKARLVAKGFTQKYGIDYFETYSPTMDIISVRIILVLIIKYNLFKIQFDVKTAFLNAPLNQSIYMSQAPGFEDGSARVYKLHKSIYGLKQAALMWYGEISNHLISFGFNKLESESCMFVMTRNKEFAIIGLFIDDGIVASTNQNLLNEIISHLRIKYEIKTCENVNRFIGLQLEFQSDQIRIHQHDYIIKILNHYQMQDCNGSKTPLPTGRPVNFNDEGSEELSSPFRSLISSLMYIARLSRPDISYAVGILSTKVNRPSLNDCSLAKRILRYLKQTISYSIIINKDQMMNSEILSGYADANFGTESRGLSRSGTLSLFYNSPIQWSSKIQNVPALSTCEAEWYSIDDLHRKLLGIRKIIEDIGIKLNAISIYNDNLPSIRILKQEFPTDNTNHVDRSFYHIKHYLANGTFELLHVSTDCQPADLLTKSLSTAKHYDFLSYFSLFDTLK